MAALGTTPSPSSTGTNMYVSRFILSAIVLVITNLIVGSISLSLGLLVTLGLAAVAVISVALLTLLGFAVVMEKMNWVRPGWTDAKIDGLRAWAKRTREAMPEWYKRQRVRTIELLIDSLKDRETRPPESARLTVLKFIVAGLLVLLSVTLLTHSAGLTVGRALAVTAFGALVISAPLMRVRSGAGRPLADAADTGERRAGNDRVVGNSGEIQERADAWETILALHRSGRLRALLEDGPPPKPSIFAGAAEEPGISDKERL